MRGASGNASDRVWQPADQCWPDSGRKALGFAGKRWAETRRASRVPIPGTERLLERLDQVDVFLHGLGAALAF